MAFSHQRWGKKLELSGEVLMDKQDVHFGRFFVTLPARLSPQAHLNVLDIMPK
jgi:hypothetical protein